MSKVADEARRLGIDPDDARYSGSNGAERLRSEVAGERKLRAGGSNAEDASMEGRLLIGGGKALMADWLLEYDRKQAVELGEQ